MKWFFIFSIPIISAFIVFLGVFFLQKRSKIILWTVFLGAAFLYTSLFVFQTESDFLSNSFILMMSIGGGTVLGLLLSHRGSLITFCSIASLADIYSFFSGPTRQIVEAYQMETSSLLSYLSISWIIEGQPSFLIGIGDLLVLGAVFYALLALRYSYKISMLVPLTGLAIALITGMLLHGIFAIPFIGIPVILFIVFRKPKLTGSHS